VIPIEPDQRFRCKLTSLPERSDAVVSSYVMFWFRSTDFGGSSSFPQGLSLHFDFVGVVNEPVENGATRIVDGFNTSP